MAGRGGLSGRRRHPIFARRRRGARRRGDGVFIPVLMAGLAAVAVLIVFLVIEKDTPTPPLIADSGSVVAHVHGLGVNPADDALLIATHNGLYRANKGQHQAELIGQSYQDTMAFTVAGPDYFLGSGHPDVAGLERGLPPLLGLIESRDGGESWQPRSLLGRADFHVLRLVGQHLYGYEATSGRLLVSTNQGRTWRERNAPGEIVDLAADPTDAKHLLATTSNGRFSSMNGGRTWGRVAFEGGLLTWPRERLLYVVDLDGMVYGSGDDGRSLTPRGDVGGEPAAVFANRDGALYVALHDGSVRVSRDGGVSWTLRSAL